MTVVGFNFKKLNVERNKPSKGKISVSNNVSIQGVEESSFSIGQDEQESLKVIFKFNSTY